MPEANDLIKGGEKPRKLLIAARLYCVYVKDNDVITFEGRDASVLRPSAGVACMQLQQHLRLLNSQSRTWMSYRSHRCTPSPDRWNV